MAVTYGFYDSLNHDRLYNAQQMSAIFDGIINDGVFMSVGNQFHTVAGTGMQVIVKSGRAWFDSTWTLNDAEYPLSIDAADVLLTRIDAVVLEVNSEVATRANTIKVVKGTPASTPAKPTLTNTATIHQHALAYVTVAKNITAITNSMIEIVVGKTETPYVTAILQTTDITDLYNQWEDYFQTWFDTVRGTLDGDVALNLQNQITSLRRETLKNTTPPIIGLPASATPDDMFQALGKTGELHVWRKTVKTSSDTPAGYTLGDTLTHGNSFIVRQTTGTGYVDAVIQEASSISVNDNGVISASWGGTISLRYGNSVTFTPGRFVKISSINTKALSSFAVDDVVWVPSDGGIQMNFSNDYGYYIEFTKCQKVNAHGIIPAGTTSTYPVSTNPNAYQEGDDAKPAGYVLGDVVSGVVVSSNTGAGSGGFHWASALTVTDDGAISLDTSANSGTLSGGITYFKDWLSSNARGHFCKFYLSSGSTSDYTFLDGLYYFPEDTVFSTTNISGDRVTGFPATVSASKMQKVTGYAAIPAGTTIEYLGKLGDKARVQVVSYVGTGTYGSSNPNSLTFDFVPKVVIVALSKDKSNNPNVMPSPQQGWSNMFLWIYGMKMTKTSSSELHFINDGKILSWYAYNYASNQCNESGSAYTAVAIG